MGFSRTTPVAVPYGNLTDQTGTLSGALASGEDISNVFYQGGWAEVPCPAEYPCSGTITLVPEPTHALLHVCALATLVLLRRRTV